MSTAFSFEIFPPRTPEAESSLRQALKELTPLRPAFISVTYGAGGSTRTRTHDLVLELQGTQNAPPMPHLTCVGHGEMEIMTLLESYAAAGVTRILAMRGDLPAGQADTAGDFAQAADLIRCIRRFNERGLHPNPKGFQIAAACFPEGHPATPNRMLEMDHLKTKVDAGVDFLITQAFFDNHAFHDFRARCDLVGIRVPIYAGILPLPTPQTMTRMAELAGNMRYPARLLRSLARTDQSAESFQAVALHHAAEQCHDLLDHAVEGIHLYTLNRSGMVKGIYERLGLLP
ncbi:MAG: methylenetetrahydrofolate reductase [Verrucomicrobiota bacterium]